MKDERPVTRRVIDGRSEHGDLAATTSVFCRCARTEATPCVS